MEVESKSILNWPIDPHFLSIRDGANKYDKKSNYSPNQDGLFYANELRGFLADISDELDIKDVLSLFQVVPSNFRHEKEGEWITEFSFTKNKIIRDILSGRKIIRIDPGKLFPDVDCCELFRKNEETTCFESDSRIVLLYDTELPKINNKEDWDDFNNKLNRIVNHYNNAIEAIDPYLIEVDTYQYCNEKREVENRPYLHYRCKYSQSTEYSFPVFHAGKVIAVLMQVSFPISFKRDEMFKKYRLDDEDRIELDNFIKNDMEERESFPYLNIKVISQRIANLEENIRNRVEAMAHEYVSKQFFNIEKEFRKGIYNNQEEKFENLDQKLADYKKVLDNTLHEIFERFNPNDEKGFIRIYAIESPIATANFSRDTFTIIGNSTLNRNNTPVKLIFNKIEKKNKTIEKQELLENYFSERYYPEEFDEENDIFYLNIPYTSEIAYIIWEKYSNLDIESEQYEKYNSYLKLIYHTLLEPYIILMGVKLERDLEASIRISDHESAQIIPSILETINNPESRELLDGETTTYCGPAQIIKPAHKIIDASFRLLLLEGLFKRSSLIFKNEQPTLSHFDFHRIIYATESLFQEKAYWDNMQKINVYIDPELHTRSLKTDYGYLSQVLFNLMDNAIKYGYRGSNIYIRAQFKVERGYARTPKEIIISIVSYGKRIEDIDRRRIFDLYYRSHEAKKTEGMGIGLFLVKKLCKLLNYNVVCKSNVLIADYHLPIKYHYCKHNPEFTQDTSIKKSVSNILKEVVDPKLLREVVNLDIQDWDIGIGELDSVLFRPTFRNEFQITIPIKENDLKLFN